MIEKLSAAGRSPLTVAIAVSPSRLLADGVAADGVAADSVGDEKCT